MDVKAVSLLLQFGLKETEISQLSHAQVAYYLNNFNGKSYSTSSLLIYGFEEKERKLIASHAKKCLFKVLTKPNEYIFSDRNKIAFICSDNLSNEVLQTSIDYGTLILPKSFFEEFYETFFSAEITLENIGFLFNNQTAVEYRTVVPLSNFNKPTDVGSFSFDNDNIYTTNLYYITCTCKDFQIKERDKFSRGDVRRLCKHLMREYRSSFGLNGLSDICRNFIDDGSGLKSNFKKIKFDDLAHSIYINYDNCNDWWNIYFPNEKGIYKKYGYHPLDERFSYDEKPRGYVKPLRLKLKELQNQLGGNPIYSTNNNSRTIKSQPRIKRDIALTNDYYPPPRNSNVSNEKKQPNTGCLTYVIGFIFICFILSLLKC